MFAPRVSVGPIVARTPSLKERIINIMIQVNGCGVWCCRLFVRSAFRICSFAFMPVPISRRGLLVDLIGILKRNDLALD